MSWRRIFSLVIGLMALAAMPATHVCAEPQAVKIAWLSRSAERTAAQAYLDPPPADEGIQGARLGIADNNTTGHFTEQSFELAERLIPADGDMAAAFRGLVGNG